MKETNKQRKKPVPTVKDIEYPIDYYVGKFLYYFLVVFILTLLFLLI